MHEISIDKLKATVLRVRWRNYTDERHHMNHVSRSGNLRPAIHTEGAERGRQPLGNLKQRIGPDPACAATGRILLHAPSHWDPTCFFFLGPTLDRVSAVSRSGYRAA